MVQLQELSINLGYWNKKSLKTLSESILRLPILLKLTIDSSNLNQNFDEDYIFQQEQLMKNIGKTQLQVVNVNFQVRTRERVNFEVWKE